MATRVEIGTGYVELGDDGILVVFHNPGIHVDLPGMQALVEAHVAIAAGRKLPVLVHATGVLHMDRDARAHSSSPTVATVTSRMALVSTSAVSVMVVNFWMRVA